MKRSYIIAAALALAATAWVLSGQLDGERQAEAQKPPAQLAAAQQLASVRVRQQSAAPHVTELVLRGRTQALRSVVVKAETEGLVEELLFERGDRMTEGQMLVRLAPKDRPAAVTEARALLEHRRIELQAAKQLSEKGYRADTQVAEAQAAHDAAGAALQRAQWALDKTKITAPFKGSVDDRLVERGAYVEPGDPIAQIVDLDPILVVAHVNEIDIGRVEVGGIGQVRLITGLEVAGQVRFVAAMAAEATRTFRVELEVPNPDGAIPDGVSAELRLPIEEVWAHRVSPAILSLSDHGVLGVKLVDAEDVVRFHGVEIVDSGPEGVWLGGLPREITLITVGQEFVVDGQKVRVVSEESLEAPEGAADPAATDMQGGEAQGGSAS
ncbi:MAG: efflux RND transporter periplasmic adaptor subunit [Kiloniellales bacterium]